MPNTPTTIPPRDWLSPEALAEWLDVPVRTVYAWNQARTGPRPTRVGKHVRYSRQAVVAWLAEREGGHLGGAA